MSVTYSTNFMGPAYTDWYKERGLTRKVLKVFDEGRIFYTEGCGYVWEYHEITAYYCAGRIDIRDSEKEGYDGWDEYSLAPMPQEDWDALDAWLEGLETEDVWPYDKLIAEFEKHYGKPIDWWEEKT